MDHFPAWAVYRLSANFLYFMEPESSLPRLQVAANCCNVIRVVILLDKWNKNNGNFCPRSYLGSLLGKVEPFFGLRSSQTFLYIWSSFFVDSFVPFSLTELDWRNYQVDFISFIFIPLVLHKHNCKLNMENVSVWWLARSIHICSTSEYTVHRICQLFSLL
jgi:hypothetical protein